MRAIIISVVIFVNFLLQSTILQYFSFMDVIPNTGLILVVSFALLDGKKTGSIVGISIGLLQDVIFFNVIGVNALIYFIIGYSIGLIQDKVFKGNLFIPFIFTGLATFGYHSLYYLFMYFLKMNVSLLYLFKNIAFIESIYNSILVIPIYNQLRKIYDEQTISFMRR